MAKPPIYQEDGTPPVMWDAEAFTQHDPTQVAVNLGGATAARQLLEASPPLVTGVLNEQVALFDDAPDEDSEGLPSLDRFERLDALFANYGFLPASLDEQTRQFMLESVVGRPGGAAKHLSEVIRRKAKAGEPDTLAAARSITGNFIKWANDAQTSRGDLETVKSDLLDVMPTLELPRVGKEYETPNPRLLPFLRHLALATLQQTHDINAAGYDPQKVDFNSENGGIMTHLEMMQADWVVNDVTKKLPEAIKHQELRQAYWMERLAEVARGYSYRGKGSPGPMAAAALKKLKPQETASV